jgi:hypothetical protein
MAGGNGKSSGKFVVSRAAPILSFPLPQPDPSQGEGTLRHKEVM